MNILDLVIHSQLRETVFLIFIFLIIVSMFAGRVSFISGAEFIWAIVLYEVINFIARLIASPFKKNKDVEEIQQLDK